MANIHLIVRLQANFRGFKARRELRAPRSFYHGSLEKRYASNMSMTNQSNVMSSGKLPGEAGGENTEVEYRSEHIFDNGAVYKG